MRRFALLLSMSVGAPLAAQTVVTSPEPSAVSVTMYRADRAADDAIDLNDLRGFALITETREVDLPPGAVTIRFEGVASGIEPVSALAFGVPVQEKNRDRRLLSQRGLLDAFTGQAVTVRRTDPATGAVTEESGTIRSAPDRLILQTQSGFEAIHCTGLNQTLVFPRVPAELTAKPTLSVTTRDQPGGKQTITLSYLAGRFDWQANYVGELSNDARHLDLLAWLTMASGDRTSFVNTQAFVVAGRVARVDDDREKMDGGLEEDVPVSYECWPSETTTSALAPEEMTVALPDAETPAPMMLKSALGRLDLEEAIVTANKLAEREDLGDLKLYRVPFAVTVAAHSQKQVAFLSKSNVDGELIYRTRLDSVDDDSDIDVELLFRLQNTTKSGLGEPLPSGKAAVFQTVGGRRMLVGESDIEDKAVGERVDLVLAEAGNVSVDVDHHGRKGKDWHDMTLTVSNANPFQIIYEAEFPNDDENFDLTTFSERVTSRNGKRVWRVNVPAHGKRAIEFRVIEKH